MNFIIFITLLVLSIVFIILGYQLQDQADIFKITGFGFLFILAVVLIPGTPFGLEYVTGTNITKLADTYIAEDITTSYQDFTFGFFLATASIFGFVNVFLTRRHEDFSNE